MIRTLIRLALVVSVATVAIGCAPVQPRPQLSQLQIREIQTRSYPNREPIVAMKAVLNALQDEGFLVRNADNELGFIQASKEVDLSPNQGFFVFRPVLNPGSQNDPRWPKLELTECSANVTPMGRDTNVRLVFQRKVLDNLGGTVEIEQVLDPAFYQPIFAKIDKSLFLEKSKLVAR